MRRRALALALVLALAAGLAGCGGESAPEQSSAPAVQPEVSQTKGEAQPITLAAYPEQSFHPAQTQNRLNLSLAPLMYEGLFELDPSFQPQPVLCRDYTVSEDGLTWTFTLQEGVTFSDGTPLTAELAAQALELARTGSGMYTGRFNCVSAISASESGQLVITLRYPNSALPALLDVPITLGADSRPLGTGPYVLREGADGTLSLELRRDWWQGLDMPQQTISLLPISQADTLIHGLDGGYLTLLSTDLTATGSLGYAGTYEVVDYGTTGMVYLAFNTARGVFRDALARRAVAAAVDRDTLAGSVYSGHAVAARLPVHPFSPLYDEELSGQLTEGEDAQDLFRQARLEQRSVTLVVNRENSYKNAAAQAVARQLEELGMTVELSSLSWDDYVSALERGEFDLYLAEVSLTADFDLTPLAGSGGSANYGRWSDRETDQLLSAFLAAPEGEQRLQAAGALYTHLHQSAPLVPLCFKNGCVLTQWGRISNLTPTRGNIFYQMDRWVLN